MKCKWLNKSNPAVSSEYVAASGLKPVGEAIKRPDVLSSRHRTSFVQIQEIQHGWNWDELFTSRPHVRLLAVGTMLKHVTMSHGLCYVRPAHHPSMLPGVQIHWHWWLYEVWTLQPGKPKWTYRKLVGRWVHNNFGLTNILVGHLS